MKMPNMSLFRPCVGRGVLAWALSAILSMACIPDYGPDAYLFFMVGDLHYPFRFFCIQFVKMWRDNSRLWNRFYA